VAEGLVEKIGRLRRERNAVILAHSYQRPEIQDIADFTGDSLGLSQQAAATKADVIVFCGVHFMAETAAMICPNKTVLIPDEHAGCPMANMAAVRQLREKKIQYPGAVVVTYVNSTAQIKAESDYCCTSSNAVNVVRAIPAEKKILFLPDVSLGAWVAKQTGRELVLWDGYCPTHHRILARDIREKKAAHPGAKVVVHPECLEGVIALADMVASTTGIIKWCKESSENEFIIGTEIGILHRLAKECPGKTFYPASELADCPNMKLITLEKVLWSLEDMVYRVTVPEDVAHKALTSINRMLAIAP
jgi:quinolinate synthase